MECLVSVCVEGGVESTGGVGVGVGGGRWVGGEGGLEDAWSEGHLARLKLSLLMTGVAGEVIYATGAGCDTSRGEHDVGLPRWVARQWTGTRNGDHLTSRAP